MASLAGAYFSTAPKSKAVSNRSLFGNKPATATKTERL